MEVLGCTHAPWVAPEIQQALGRHVGLIDTAPSVADRLLRCRPVFGSGGIKVTRLPP
jgi:glutamate racemase